VIAAGSVTPPAAALAPSANDAVPVSTIWTRCTREPKRRAISVAAGIASAPVSEPSRGRRIVWNMGVA